MTKKIKTTIYILVILMTSISCGSKTPKLIEDIDLKSGKYYLNISQINFHSFKHFNVKLEVKNDSIKLFYLSSEEYGYSELWKEGDVYAEGKLSDKNAEGILLKVWENRGESKILTKGYFFKPIQDGFQITLKTKRENYTDHYSIQPHQYRINHDSLFTQPNSPHNSEDYHNEIERSLIDFGITKTKNWNEYLLLLKQVEKTDFPYNNIPTKREFITRMGFSFGVRLNKEKKWKWAYIKNHRNDYLGWTIINPNKTIGIPIENYFFEKSFYFRDIKFNQLFEIINGKRQIEIEENEMVLYEPWLNYEEY